MTGRSLGAGLLVFTSCLLAFACSPSSSGGGGAGGAPGDGTGGAGGNVLGCQNAGFSAECMACIDSSCSAERSDVESACSAYLSCVATCSCTDTPCLQGCDPMRTDGCITSQSTLATCISDNCDTVCLADGEGGAAGSAGAAGMGGTAGGAGGAGAGGSGDVTWACYTDPTKQCTQGKGSSFGRMQAQMLCAMGGVFGDMCPADGVLGCCAMTNGATCYYAGLDYDAAKLAGACAQGGGTWVATPP